jgi:hypothetical protein
MTNQRQPVFALRTLFLAALLCFLTLSCLPLSTIGPMDPFQLNRIGAADTISPWGSVQIRFSYPVRFPDSVTFAFTPAFDDYRKSWNTGRDTLSLVFVLPLHGGVHHTMLLANFVESEEGSILIPGEDTLSFYTYPAEQEPNDSKATSDLLKGTVFGSISAANDSDWFAVDDSAVRSFYLLSTGSTSQFELHDSDGSVTHPPSFTMAETLSVPESFIYPFYIVVHSYNRSNGGYYQLGMIKE